MARRTPKCPAGPPIIDSNQFGCMPGFSGIFDFHHGRPCQKLLLNDTHGIRNLTGAEQTRNQAKTLTSFDESCRCINKKNKKAKKEAVIIVDPNPSLAMSLDLAAHDEGFCNQIPLKKGKHSNSSRTKHYQIDENSLQMVKTVEKSLWKRIMKSRYGYPNKGKQDLHQSKSFGSLKPDQKSMQNFHKERAGSSSGATNRENKKGEPVDSKSIIRSSLLTVAYSKKQELDIFAEARKHLSERLRKVEKVEALSSKKGPRTLERILLLSPKHELRATLSPKSERVNGSVSEQMRFSPYGNSPLAYEKSLQTKKEKKMNDHNELDDPFMTDHPSSSGYVEILETPSEKSITDTAKIIKENELPSENELSKISPDRSPSSTVNICKLQITNMDKEREENPSPVSILEPFFMDDVSSPSSSFTESAETPMHPLRLDFDEHPEINLSANMKNRDLISRYVVTVYRHSQLNWDEFLAKGWPAECCCDQKLLHDCIKEVLIDLHQQYYEYPPFISFLKPEIHAVRMEEKLVNEVMKEVDWYTIPRATPSALARKDIAKHGKWIDIRVDAEDIVIEIVEDALEDSILEMIDDLYLQI